ncbi:MAG: ankyrin repeat domain-containing protein, partial [Deltaproteobacteria bacterium]|nr:ankyrin repeat domain-containing protein [Deltaproteobacteria bacterium]
LYLAARNGHLDVVKLLLKNQADLTIANQHEESPVDAAMKSGNREIEDLLREAGGRSGKTTLIELSE